MTRPELQSPANTGQVGPMTELEFNMRKQGDGELYDRALEVFDGNQAQVDRLLPEAVEMVMRKEASTCFLP